MVAIDPADGLLKRVNAAGDGWAIVPNYVIAATEPTDGLFAGLFWYDTANAQLQAYNGTSFVEVGGTGSAIDQTARDCGGSGPR